MADTSSILYQAGQAVSQKISSIASTFNGGTITNHLEVATDTPKISLRDTSSTGSPSNQAKYLRFLNSEGSQHGFVGYGSNGDLDLDVYNAIGDVRLSAKAGSKVLAGNIGGTWSEVITDTSISGYLPTVSTSSQWVLTATGSYGTVKVEDNRSKSWAGYAIRDDWVFMANGANESGIYNDTDNEWAIKCWRNAQVDLYHNGSVKLGTSSAGVSVTGTLTATALSGDGANISNVNADKVDGLHASSFIRSDANETITKGSRWDLGNSVSEWAFKFHNGSYTNDYVYMCGPNGVMHIRNDSSNTDGYLLDCYAANGNRFRVRGADALTTINGNTVYHAGNLPAYPTVSSASQKIKDASGNYGSVKVTSNIGGYAGYAIQDDWVFMSNGPGLCGLYNDTNNEWALICRQNAETELFHNGSRKLETSSYGIYVDGGVFGSMSGEISSTGKGRFGGWGSYTQFSGAALEVGMDSNKGWILPYNRSTATYLDELNLQVGNNKLQMKKSDYTNIWSDGLQLGTYSAQAPTLRLYPSPTSGTSVINTGYGSDLSIKSNHVEAMNIDTGGRIRMPTMPMVLMKRTTHVTATGYVVCNEIVNGIGTGSYSTSNGRYTAPRTGRYVCSITVMPYSFNTSNTSTLHWYVNGSHKAFAGMYTRMSGNYYGQGNTLTFYLNQGDYIQVYFNRSGSCGLHSNYTYFSAAYIG